MSKKSKKPKNNKERKHTVQELFDALCKIRSEMLNDPVAKDIANELNDDTDPEDFLKCVPISFEEMDVSAKTQAGKIQLNYKLIDKPFNVMMRYVMHELTHAVQHILNDGSISKDSDEDYLDKESEIEAFQRQIEYQSNNSSNKEVEKYVDELLSYHDVPKKEREEKKEELLELSDATNK